MTLPFESESVRMSVCVCVSYVRDKLDVSSFFQKMNRSTCVPAQEHEVAFKYQSQMEEAFQNQAVWTEQPVAWLTSDRVGSKSVSH